METLREYASRHGISYEAVRKQVRRYAKELNGHITREDGQQRLDDYAADFLDKHRGERTMLLSAADDDLRQALLSAHEEIRRLQAQIIAKDEQIIDMKDKQLAIADKLAHIDLLETRATENEEQLRAKEQELADTKAKLEAAEKDAQSYERTVFGLYKKKV